MLFKAVACSMDPQLIYEVAMLNNVKVPEKCHETKVAGIEYLYNLRKRDNRLSLSTIMLVFSLII